MHVDSRFQAIEFVEGTSNFRQNRLRRLPAGEIESGVIEQIKAVFRSPGVLAHAVRACRDLQDGLEEQCTINALLSIEEVWDKLFPAEQARIAHTLIERITVRREGATIDWTTDGLETLLHSVLPAPRMK